MFFYFIINHVMAQINKQNNKKLMKVRAGLSLGLGLGLGIGVPVIAGCLTTAAIVLQPNTQNTAENGFLKINNLEELADYTSKAQFPIGTYTGLKPICSGKTYERIFLEGWVKGGHIVDGLLAYVSNMIPSLESASGEAKWSTSDKIYVEVSYTYTNKSGTTESQDFKWVIEKDYGTITFTTPTGTRTKSWNDLLIPAIKLNSAMGVYTVEYKEGESGSAKFMYLSVKDYGTDLPL